MNLKELLQVHDRKAVFDLSTRTVDNFVGKLRQAEASA
jgi:hypothetical protein